MDAVSRAVVDSWAERQLPGRAEQRVAPECRNGRPESGDGRQPGHPGVRENLEDQEGRDGQAGHQVAAQGGAVVRAQRAQTGPQPARNPGEPWAGGLAQRIAVR